MQSRIDGEWVRLNITRHRLYTQADLWMNARPIADYTSIDRPLADARAFRVGDKFVTRLSHELCTNNSSTKYNYTDLYIRL